MNCSRQLVFSLGIASMLALATPTNVGADREKFASSGCVSWPADVNNTGRQAVLVWSGGQVFSVLQDMRFKPVQPYPVGTTGTWVPMFFLIDDTGNFGRYLDLNVQISGDLTNNVAPGAVRIEQDGDYTVTEFQVDGRETRVRVPNEWLGAAVGDQDANYDVALRTVDLKRVVVLGSCWTESQRESLWQ